MGVLPLNNCFPNLWIAREIRVRIKREAGITVRIGVSYNEIFAKLGSIYQKPDAVTTFRKKMCD